MENGETIVSSELKTKVCPKCGRELPVSAFNRRAASADGLQYWCRECSHKAYYKPKGKALSSAAVTIKGALSCDDPNNPLASFKPRQLIDELRRRGYKGKLTFTNEIVL